MSSLSKSTHSMGDRHYLHSRKYRQQKTRRHRYHPYTKPTTISFSVMDDEEDKSRERCGEERQNQSLIQKITHSTYDMKTPRPTFEKREESQSISPVITTTDPRPIIISCRETPEPSISEKLWTTSCSASLLVIVILDRSSSIEEKLGTKDGSCSSTQKYFS